MRISPRGAAKSVLVGVVALSGSVAIGLNPVGTSAAGLVAAVTPLIVPGTGTPDPAASENYLAHAVSYYVDASGSCGMQDCAAPVPIPYIAQFWPFPFAGWGGLEGAKWNVSVASGVTRLTGELVGDNNPSAAHPVAIFGYSQGATVASIVKGNLADLTDEQKQNLSFVLIGNPNRPDGGLFERLAILGTVPVLDATFGRPTPTDTGIETHDIALQYDGVSDAPSWVLNPLALANALAGFEYVHGTYLAPDGDDAPTETPYGYTPEQVQAAISNAAANCSVETHCQKVDGSDTFYITLPAKTLPIMQPLLDLGAATGTSAVVIPLVDLISPMAQTLIETGYTRTDYSKPTPFQLLPRFNPVKVVSDLAGDIPQGVRAALNPGLDPLPGWTDPTAPTTPSITDTDEPETAVLAAKTSAPVSSVAPRKSLRLSTVAQPGLTTPDKDTPAAADRPSLRKALGIKGHPVRALTKQVRSAIRTALGKNDADKPAKRDRTAQAEKPEKKSEKKSDSAA